MPWNFFKLRNGKCKKKNRKRDIEMNREGGFFVQITPTDKDIDTGWYTGKIGEIFHIHRVGSDGENKNEKNCKKSTHRQDNN